MNRAQRRASLRGARPRPVAYDVAISVIGHHDWNSSDERAQLDEEPCGGSCYVVLGSTAPAGTGVVDQGSVLVAHYPLSFPAWDAAAQVGADLFQRMNDRHGLLGWEHSGVIELVSTVPEWNVAYGEAPVSRAEGLARFEAGLAAYGSPVP